MVARNSTGIPVEHLRKLVRSRLLDMDAISLHGLTSFVGQDHESVARIIEGLVADGEVEILQPVGGAASDTDGSADGVFYRSIRETDRDFVWEKEVNTRQIKDGPQEIKKTWLSMLDHGDDMDLSVLKLIQTMNMA